MFILHLFFICWERLKRQDVFFGFVLLFKKNIKKIKMKYKFLLANMIDASKVENGKTENSDFNVKMIV